MDQPVLDLNAGEKKKKRRKYIIIFGLVLAAALLGVGTYRWLHKADISEYPLLNQTGVDYDVLYAQYSPYGGVWEGKWENKISGNKGTVTATVSFQKDGLVQVIADIDGLVYGLVDPDPRTYLGYYDGKGIHFVLNRESVFGEVTIDALDGKIDAKGFRIPFTRINGVAGQGSYDMKTTDIVYQVANIFLPGSNGWSHLEKKQ